MSEIHIRQIKQALHKRYDGLVDLSDYQGKSEADRESAFLTRSLAAFALTILADVEPKVGADAITDGGQDNGIDALYHDPNEQVLYIVQSKWRHGGKGSVERGEVLKLINGFNDLINSRFERFNSRVQTRSTLVESVLSNPQTRLVIVLIYTGQEALADVPHRDLKDLLDEINNPVQVLSLEVLRQAEIYTAVAQGYRGAPIDIDVVLYEWGQTHEPYQAYYGQVSAVDVASWWKHHYLRLFTPNIRMFLGDTEVNRGLINTLVDEPEHFWYFNNGITALCGKIEKSLVGGASRDAGHFKCTDLRIVNGAQTVGAIAKADESHHDAIEKARVTLRLVSLEQCPEGFDRQITRSNNTQNRVQPRDFVALDPEQQRIQSELQVEGVHYVYKAGDTVPGGEQGFDLTEATIARACAEKDLALAVQAKRGIGELWDSIEKAPYKVLFNASVSGPELWELVQVLRVVESTLADIKKANVGRARLLAVHGNRFVAHQVYATVGAELTSITGLLPDTIAQRIKAETARTHRQTLNEVDNLFPDAYLASVFKNLSRCRLLKEKVSAVSRSDPGEQPKES